MKNNLDQQWYACVCRKPNPITPAEARKQGMERLTAWLPPTPHQQKFFLSVAQNLCKGGSVWAVVKKKTVSGRYVGKQLMWSIWRVMPEGITLGEGE